MLISSTLPYHLDLPAILKSIKDDAKKNNNKKYIFDFCDSLLEQNFIFFSQRSPI